jgi:hypothetical protein
MTAERRSADADVRPVVGGERLARNRRIIDALEVASAASEGAGHFRDKRVAR